MHFKKFLFLMIVISLLFSFTTISLLAVSPTEPYTTIEDGRYVFSTFITSDLSEDNKQFMRDCFDSDQRLMSIDCTTDKLLFSFGIVPSTTSFTGFEKIDINDIETIIANFDNDVDIMTFEFQDGQYIFKSHQSSNKIQISYLIDTTYFNSLNPKIDLPQSSYDWQKYIPALIKDDDGLEQTVIESSQSHSSSAVDALSNAEIKTELSSLSQVKDYVWIGVGILVGLLALVGIVKLLKK